MQTNERLKAILMERDMIAPSDVTLPVRPTKSAVLCRSARSSDVDLAVALGNRAASEREDLRQ
jgi:hypothetical protein